MIKACGATITIALPWDVHGIQEVLRHTWINTYSAIIGREHAIQSAQRFSKPYLLWLISSGLLGTGSFLKAVVSGRIVGVAYAVMDDKEVVLYLLYVRPENQGQGVGSALLAEVERWKLKAGKIRLETLRDNEQAVDWYVSRGFAKYGSTENATGMKSVPSIYLDKHLPKDKVGCI
jgi:ribosomal protein S18 acetylase RimI-like enzyme